MQLLVITIDDCDEFLATLEGLRAHGMNGIVFQSTSLKHALLNSNVDAPPIFGRVSKIMSHDFESSHTAFLLLALLFSYSVWSSDARDHLVSTALYPGIYRALL